MVKNLIKLSVLGMLLNFVSIVQADSFLLPVHSSVCTNIQDKAEQSEIRYQTYDKAIYQAVKSSSYLHEKGLGLDDHAYNLLAYRLADKALNDVSVKTIRDDEVKICLEIEAYLDKTKADEVIKELNMRPLNLDNAKKVAKEVNIILPKSIYETDSSMPLIYIKDLEFYNHTKTARYTYQLAQQLSFEPRVLVTEYENLADYLLCPKLLQSKIEKIDEENSRYNMSVLIEIRDKNGNVIDSKQQNRYIIIANSEDKQKIAHKLLTKLLKDALTALSGRLNAILKE